MINIYSTEYIKKILLVLFLLNLKLNNCMLQLLSRNFSQAISKVFPEITNKLTSVSKFNYSNEIINENTEEKDFSINEYLIRSRLISKYDELVPEKYKKIGNENMEKLKLNDFKTNFKRLFFHEFSHICQFTSNYYSIELNIINNYKKLAGSVIVSGSNILTNIFGLIGESIFYSPYRHVKYPINCNKGDFYNFINKFNNLCNQNNIKDKNLFLNDIIEKSYLFFIQNITEIENIFEKEIYPILNQKPIDLSSATFESSDDKFEKRQFDKNKAILDKELSLPKNTEEDLRLRINFDINDKNISIIKIKNDAKNIMEEINNNIASGRYNKSFINENPITNNDEYLDLKNSVNKYHNI